MGTSPGVVVDARRGTREPSQACSVEAARTASAVRGDQDHEDRDHCQRQPYSQPRLPVPPSPTVDSARVVHLEPPFKGFFLFRQDAPTGSLLSSRLATISHPGRPDLQDACVLLPSTPGLETGHFEANVSDGAARRQAVGSIGKNAITVEFVAVGEVTTSPDSSS
jgi:hypothetical protein